MITLTLGKLLGLFSYGCDLDHCLSGACVCTSSAAAAVAAPTTVAVVLAVRWYLGAYNWLLLSAPATKMDFLPCTFDKGSTRTFHITHTACSHHDRSPSMQLR